jgi:hypothetical protein
MRLVLAERLNVMIPVMIREMSRADTYEGGGIYLILRADCDDNNDKIDRITMTDKMSRHGTIQLNTVEPSSSGLCCAMPLH